MSSGLFTPEFRVDGSVAYWSVYNQVWKTAASELDIPDREWAAMSAADRVAILRYFGNGDIE